MKRKIPYNIELSIKIQKLLEYNKKRKNIPIESLNKKQKSCNCIIHEEKYICDIYECNGKVNRDKFRN